MPKIPAINPLLQAWLLEGPLSAQVPAYVERLRRGRYATHTSSRCLNGVAHFAHWMSMCHLPAHMLNEGCVDQFLRYHLPRCDCLGGALRTPMELHAALMPVLCSASDCFAATNFGRSMSLLGRYFSLSPPTSAP